MRTIKLVYWAIIVRSLVGQGLLVGVVGPKSMVPTTFFYNRFNCQKVFLLDDIIIFRQSLTIRKFWWNNQRKRKLS